MQSTPTHIFYCTIFSIFSPLCHAQKISKNTIDSTNIPVMIESEPKKKHVRRLSKKIRQYKNFSKTSKESKGLHDVENLEVNLFFSYINSILFHLCKKTSINFAGQNFSIENRYYFFSTRRTVCVHAMGIFNDIQ